MIWLSLAFAVAPPIDLTPEQSRAMQRDGSAIMTRVAGHFRAGRFDAALGDVRRMEAVYRAAVGRDHLLTLETAKQVALIRERAGDWGGAAEARREVLRMTRALWGPGHWREGDARRDVEEAVAQTRRSAAVLAALDRAARLNADAVGRFRAGDPAAALGRMIEGQRLTERSLGERHPRTLAGLNNLAVLTRAVGDDAAALRLNRRLLALRLETVGEAHPDTALSLNNLAAVYQARGQFDEAVPLLRRAIESRRAALGEWHPDTAISLGNLGTLQQERGDLGAALTLYQQALVTTRAAHGERHVDHGLCLNNLAEVHRAMGDLDTAVALHRQALTLRQELLPDGHPETAISLFNLGGLLRERGQLDEALPLLKRGAEVRRKAFTEKHPAYAAALAHLGRLHAARREPAEAAALFERAAEVIRTAYGERHPDRVAALAELAAVHHRAGDRRAGVSVRQALAASDRRPPALLRTAAAYYAADGRPLEALALADEAVEAVRAGLDRDALVQSERIQFLALAAARPALDLRLSLPERAVEPAYALVLTWKGAVFAAQRQRRVLRQASADPATRRWADLLEETTRQLLALTRRPGADPERVAQLTRQRDEIEGRLAGFAEARRRVTVHDIALPADAALVDYLVYGGRLAARVVRAGRVVRVELGPVAPVEETLTAWRTALARGDDGADHAAALHKLVWAPLRSHLGGTVLVSPDGPLARLPFAALPGDKPGTFLIEDVRLATVPVPAELAFRPEPVRGPAALLTVGGVDFDAAIAGRATASAFGLRWPALPATRPEADAVGRAFAGTVGRLSGDGATRAALADELPKHRFAHLATHGFFAPPRYRAALDAAARRDGLLGESGVAGWTPSLLSGLALAGANRPTEDDDGVLTALQVGELDLSRMELAVLSACETGLGTEAAGEGLLGLQRAFAVAGCRSVVSSLWSVHDAATGVLMERFYHHLWEGKRSKLDALRLAQLDVLRNPEWVRRRGQTLVAALGERGVKKVAVKLPDGAARSPAAWWAAWQLSGDWR